MERRQFLKFGAMTAAGLVTSCSMPAPANSSTLKQGTAEGSPLAPFAPAKPLKPEGFAGRLAALKKRTRNIDPVSVRLMRALRRIPHSVLVYDLDQVDENYLSFREALPGFIVRYAIKCCPNPAVLYRLARLGSGFDFASRGELDLALAAGASPEVCIFSNTVKKIEDIQYARNKGITAYVADSKDQVRAQAKYAPGSRLYVRIISENKDAAHPLGDKFGCTVEHAVDLLRLGKKLGLEPYGTHFHVGTQCYSSKAYAESTRNCAHVFQTMMREGVNLRFFDIGGGFPVQYLERKVPTLPEIYQQVEKVLRSELPGYDLTLAAEPGRALVGTAAAMSTRVLLRAQRPTGEWLHLDVGVYQGLSDSPSGIIFPISHQRLGGVEQSYTLCGPTCDSADTISTGQKLTSAIQTGDLLVLNRTGAYSEALSTYFNDMPSPKVRYLGQILPGS